MPSLALRARRGSDAVELELAFDHPMESGARADARGTRIPSRYVTRVTLRHDGAPLATFRAGPAVAGNPVVTLTLPPGLAGTLEAEWLDNRGERGTRTLVLDP